MAQGFATILLGALVELRNGLRGRIATVYPSHQGFGCCFSVIIDDPAEDQAILQTCHDGDVVALKLANGGPEARIKTPAPESAKTDGSEAGAQESTPPANAGKPGANSPKPGSGTGGNSGQAPRPASAPK